MEKLPNAWKGQYTRGSQQGPTVMLEVVASHDMWIWHAFFGMAGSNEDSNVLNNSSIFDALKNVSVPLASFYVDGHHYTKGYYLGEGIYPDWATLIKGYSQSMDEKRAKFKRFQESARKGVERTFGVLQGRFDILKSPTRAIRFNKLKEYMNTCIMLHNMIQEDNGFQISLIKEAMLADPYNRPRRNIINRSRDRDTISREIRDRRVHDQLREDLTEHIWNLPATFVALTKISIYVIFI
ncbi:uncharacterized protein [Rutidosis leptorrhynchoides]|uniref:uncharacterized protein n=1 Tax=Rutidosis leptorrhynchoides TaxID=125765 RepID=UPI003A99369D